MTIENKWTLRDGELYFAGLSGPGEAFLPLCAKTRTYKTKRSAEAALRAIQPHYESPYIQPCFIERAEVPEPDEPDKPDELPAPQILNAVTEALPPLDKVPITCRGGWKELDNLCGKAPAILRRKNLEAVYEMSDGGILATPTERYALRTADGEMYYLPGDEIFAWLRYFEECGRFVKERVRARRAAQGLDPDGMDEWKEDKG